MIYLHRWSSRVAILAAFFIVSVPAMAQWQVPNHSVPVGRGAGTGFKSFGPCGANVPLIGGGSSADPGCGTISGNTSKFPTTTGSLTTGNCIEIDASGNFVDAGTVCGGVIPTNIYNPITAAPYNAQCNGVADDSTAIQAAINALPAAGGYIDLPRDGSRCMFGTTLDLKGHDNVKIRGGNRIGTTTQVSNLIYTGSGTRAIDARDTKGTYIYGVYLGWNNAAFAGKYLDLGGVTPGTTVSFYARLEESQFTKDGSGSATGVTCLNLSEAIEVWVKKNSFNYCNVGIHGQNVLNQSTTVILEQNQFFQTNTVPIQECGNGWTLIGNIFEQRQNGQAAAMTVSPSLPCNQIAIIGNWYGDVTSAGGTWYNGFTANGAFISGDFMVSNGGANGGYNIVGGNGYTFQGGQYGSMSFAFVCDTTTKPTGITWISNYLSSVTTSVINFTSCLNSGGEANTPDFTTATWTPAYAASGGGTVTASTVSALYRKRGTKMEVSLNLTVSGVSTPSGALQVTGIPIAPTQKCIFTGNDSGTSQTLSGSLAASSTTLNLFLASNPATFPVGAGSNVTISAICSIS